MHTTGTPDTIDALLAKSRALEGEGRIGAAFRAARQALERAQVAGDPASVAVARQHLAYLHFRQGQYPQARRLARQALAHLPPDSPHRADALILLGLCAAETDDLTTAEAFFHRALVHSRELDYPRGMVRALHNLSATVYVPRGQFTLALAADEESLRLAQEKGLHDALWFPLATMGWVYWTTGRYEQARAAAESLRQRAQPGSLAEGFAACLLADLAQEGGTPAEALPLYARARSIAEAVGDPGLGVLLRLGLSRYHRAVGEGAAAYNWANDGLAIATRVGYHHLQGMALIERGRAGLALGDLDGARDDLEAAIEVLTPLEANLDLARASLLLAAVLHRQQHAGSKARWIEAASRIVSGGYAFLLERERAIALPLLAAYSGSDDPDVRAVATDLLTRLARVPPPPLHILTLGRFRVRQAAREIPPPVWRRRKAGELLRLLLVSPRRSLSWEQAIEALWPTRSPESARSLLHQATSALRRALEPDLPTRFPSRYLEVEEGRIALHLPPGSWVDFEAFERHVRNQEWEKALALYQGELFPDDRYADWAIPLRERLAQHYVRAALAVARQRLSEQPEQALEICRRILATEPWQEEAVLLGMRACAALNDRAGALQLYRALERRLREDLGITPQAEVQQYYRSLLRK